ncbi:MAG: transcriptional repressor [Anaerolineae bacterium]|nr:transcriptional repressor [Anaerolineae bacterium]
MNAREQTFVETLRANNYKLTRARRALIHALAGASKPLTINGLHARAKEIDPKIGLVTVYRTLELLSELDLVRSVHLADECHGYAVSTPGHTHHLICRACHALVEIDGCNLGAFLKEVEQRTGYRITGHWLEFEGLCPKCAEAEK